MDVRRYARERWYYRQRDESEVAAAYIKLALDSADPMKMLMPAVTAAVAEEFRKARVQIEDSVPWSDLSYRPGRRKRTYLGANHSPSALDAINTLMKTNIWVWRTGESGRAEGRMITWAELTIDDIEPTIAQERKVIAGHERRIAHLEKARELMTQYKVSRFGEVPFGIEKLQQD